MPTLLSADQWPAALYLYIEITEYMLLYSATLPENPVFQEIYLRSLLEPDTGYDSSVLFNRFTIIIYRHKKKFDYKSFSDKNKKVVPIEDTGDRIAALCLFPEHFPQHHHGRDCQNYFCDKLCVCHTVQRNDLI